MMSGDFIRLQVALVEEVSEADQQYKGERRIVSNQLDESTDSCPTWRLPAPGPAASSMNSVGPAMSMPPVGTTTLTNSAPKTNGRRSPENESEPRP